MSGFSWITGCCLFLCMRREHPAASRRHADSRSHCRLMPSPPRPPPAKAFDRSKASCRCPAAPAASACAAAFSPDLNPAARSGSKPSRHSARRSSSSPDATRRATLVLPREHRVLKDTGVAEVLERLTGLALGADDLRLILSGCLRRQGRAVRRPAVGRRMARGDDRARSRRLSADRRTASRC